MLNERSNTEQYVTPFMKISQQNQHILFMDTYWMVKGEITRSSAQKSEWWSHAVGKQFELKAGSVLGGPGGFPGAGNVLFPD